MQGAAALGKHWALPCAQCHGVLWRILSRDCPVVGIRYNDATLKSLPRYRGFLAGALLSLARRLQNLLSAFADTHKVMGAVCHGPAGLVGVKLKNGLPLVAGKQITGFTNEEARAAGMHKLMPFLL